MSTTVSRQLPDRWIIALLYSVGTFPVLIGLMIAGPVADLIGIQARFLVGGAMCVLMALAGFFIPAVMNMEAEWPSADALDVAA